MRPSAGIRRWRANWDAGIIIHSKWICVCSAVGNMETRKLSSPIIAHVGDIIMTGGAEEIGRFRRCLDFPIDETPSRFRVKAVLFIAD